MKKQPAKFKAFVVTDGEQWGEYVRAGDTYTVTPPNDAKRKGDYHFWNEARQCGTFMRAWRFREAVNKGWIRVGSFSEVLESDAA